MKSRAQLRAETLAALRDGEVAQINDGSCAFVPPHAQSLEPMKTTAK